MPINSRAETVAISPLFKGAFLHSRCLIPATHYFEWKRIEVDGKLEKHPYAFKLKDQNIFSFAGICSMREDAGKMEP